MNRSSNVADLVTDTLFRENYGVFEIVYRDLLRNFLFEVERTLENSGIPIQSKERVLTSISFAILSDLTRLSVKSILSLLYDRQQELEGDTPEARYNDFVRRFVENRFEEIFPPYSEARRLIEHRLTLSKNAIQEAFSRLEADREEIADRFGFEISSLHDFSMSAGDTHNAGRSVYIFTFNNGEKLVYKPHSLYNDILWNETLCWFNSHPKLKAEMRHMNVLDRGKYGWQAFVEAPPCTGKEEATRYMYRLGVLLFISYLLCFNDLHLDNIIANGEYPIVIDTETLSANRSFFERIKQDRGESSIEQMINASVFMTLLLPTDYLNIGEKIKKADISGLLGGLTKQKEKGLHLINRGRDDIGFDDGEFEVEDRAENIAHLSWKPLDPKQYIDDIIRGFQTAYDIILKNTGDFICFVHETPFSNGIYRQLMRSTGLYVRYLEASYHPYYLKDKSTREAVFSRLKGKGEFANECHKRLVASETEQLLNDDIPYFNTFFDSLDLYPPYGEKIPGFFSETLRDQLIKRVTSFSEKDKWRQSYFIRCSLMGKENDFPEEDCYPLFDGSVAAKTETEKAEFILERIFDIRENVCLWNGSGEMDGFFNVDKFGINGRFTKEEAGVYQGSGSALFNLHLFRLFGEEFRSAAEQTADYFLNELSSKDLAFEKVGLFTGAGSYLYLSLQAYRILGREKYLRQCLELCRKLLDADLPKKGEADVVDGYTGTLVFCLNASKTDPSLRLLHDLAMKYGEAVMALYKENQITLQNGLAHGYSGNILAFLMLSKETGNDEYYRAAMDLLQQERTLYVPESNCWTDARFDTTGLEAWCYGSGGVLIARMSSLPFMKPEDRPLAEEDISHCIDKLLEKTDISMPFILCHGLAGNLDILLWYLQQREDAMVRAFVEEKNDEMLQHILEKGVITELAGGIIDFSFMTGIAGLGYYLLRMLDPGIPSVLALETM